MCWLTAEYEEKEGQDPWLVSVHVHNTSEQIVVNPTVRFTTVQTRSAQREIEVAASAADATDRQRILLQKTYLVEQRLEREMYMKLMHGDVPRKVIADEIQPGGRADTLRRLPLKPILYHVQVFFKDANGNYWIRDITERSLRSNNRKVWIVRAWRKWWFWAKTR